MKSNIAKAPAVLAAMALCASVGAQTMYKCGRQYQDRPCDAGQQGKVMGGAAPSQPAPKAGADAECAQRGSAALIVVWAREGGATAERQLSDIEVKNTSPSKKAEERKLVQDVYQKRGSAPEIRAAIEADCAVEKEKAAQAAALAAAAARLQGDIQPAAPVTPATSSGPSDQDLKAAEERRRQEMAANEAERKRRQCASLNADLERNRSSQRASGSIASMEKLNEQRRRIEGQVREAGC
jgi:hypothetical protein